MPLIIKQAAKTCPAPNLFLRKTQLKTMDQPTSEPFKSAYNEPGSIDMESELNNSTAESPTAIKKYKRACVADNAMNDDDDCRPRRHRRMACNEKDNTHVARDTSARRSQDVKQKR
mmetsp:Transcript_13123/g.16576  ORF Transcript_13123/g.16576 Transcript_13123/m.16576 type:complete len:116 (-) Transcript_13123:175-522(-)